MKHRPDFSCLYFRNSRLILVILDQITSFSKVKANEIGDSLTDLKVRIKMTYGMMDFDKYDSIMAVGEWIEERYPSYVWFRLF